MARIGLVSLLVVDNVNLQLVKRILNKNAIRIYSNYLANKTQKCIASYTAIWYWDRDVHMQLDKEFTQTIDANGSYPTNQFALRLIVTCGGKNVNIMQIGARFIAYVNKKYSYESGNIFLIDLDDGRMIDCENMSMFEAVSHMMLLD
jgi:hypothetical protein